MTAKAVAIFGTSSDVGKSMIAAGLCRLLSRAGIRVAPFKAQNMSLNSFVTAEGGEIGRAQALQAEACGLPPHVDMNPILLKPESDCRSQLVVLGKVYGQLEASNYFEKGQELFRIVQESYARLADQHDVMVIEGAGSAAEVNLRARDLVNWPVAHLADAQVLLVADIDRGGVFAQVVGTLDLLQPEERVRVRGIIINKFRGDAGLFNDGIEILEARTGIPVVGVVPFLRDLTIDQEDSLDVNSSRKVKFGNDCVNIAVILLPRMSNFTDFNALAAEPDVALRYVSSPPDIFGADVVVIPGSKNTLGDLRYLEEKGFRAVCDAHVLANKEVIGICGGYQMLGRKIADPYQVEQGGSMPGLGYLNIETVLRRDKRTTQVQASPVGPFSSGHTTIQGYQIHMGVTTRVGDQPCFRIVSEAEAGNGTLPRDSPDEGQFDGAMNANGCVWGTYIHGLFDQPTFRRFWLNSIRIRKGLPSLTEETSIAVNRRLHGELDRWANHLEAHLRIGTLLKSLQS